MIRRWSRPRFVAFSAVVAAVALALGIWASRIGRRRANAQETRRELVLAATSSRGAVAVYDSRADRGLVALDAYVDRLRREQLFVMLGIGVAVVAWAGVTRAWLAGRATPRRSDHPTPAP